MQPNESEITNYKPVLDNSEILNAEDTLLTFNVIKKEELNIALDIKNYKIYI